jgi:gliding motility-associated lipoprotein GldD
MMNFGNRILLFVVFLLGITACSHNYSPKPNGYMRIDFPEKAYTKFNGTFPYSFEYPVYGVITRDSQANAEPFWINIEFPQYKGKIHLSYKPLNNNLAGYIEDTRKLAYKHSSKADAIDEILLTNDTTKVYGILYNIKGNTASSIQFFVTDSIRNFIRGALYFSSQPNKDSLAPSIAFFKKDVERFIQTVSWANNKKQ